MWQTVKVLIFTYVFSLLQMLEASLEEFGDSTVTSVELKNAEKEIFRLELEASRALKENKQ